jgi:[ribosomal protein S5]-alanine N-acetyltransferase
MFARVLEGARLRLRPFVDADLDQVFAYASDPTWARYLPVPLPYTRAHARGYLATHRDRDWNTEPVWACVLEGSVIGGIDLGVHPSGHRASIGYSIARRAWGHGLATEAAALVVDHAFVRSASILRIFAECDVENVGSWRVMEKIGMRREGILRAHGRVRERVYDEAVYAILRPEWQALRDSRLARSTGG